MHLNGLFGSPTIEDSIYSAICSGQDEHVISVTNGELKKVNPRIRLVLTTSIAGLGFDPKNVTKIIHTCSPRDISQYLQEIGRAGRDRVKMHLQSYTTINVTLLRIYQG